MPQLKKFVESGGSIVTIGSSTSIAEVFGMPVKNHLTEKGPDGKDRALPREKFYIPGFAAEGERRQHQSAGLRHAGDRWMCSSTTARCSAWSRLRR